MIHQNEILLKSHQQWLHFSNPHLILRAEQIECVKETLSEVERLVNDKGWFAAGFVSYEAASAFDPAFSTHDPGGFPFAWFGLYPAPKPIIFSHRTESQTELEWKPSINKSTYTNAIDKIRQYIARGYTYQVNYTMQLDAIFSGPVWDFFLQLTSLQNKYAAFLDTGSHIICSTSPELFFKLDGDRIFSKPMKGTAKRGRTLEEDISQAEWLRTSEKNRAENIMIVDMIRNDLGRIAITGTVEVPKLFEIEKYSTVHQMTSTVQARTNASIAEIFSALFPCASITGAPKISAMKIIAELENRPRKIYTGSIGYIAPGRKAQFNVAIRTALINKQSKSAEYGVGGGIIWDSESMDEYQEALLKAKVLQTTDMPDFSLIETILWTPTEGFFLLEKHLNRLRDSSEYFNFPFTKNQIIRSLDLITSRFPLKVRVVLDSYGNIKIESSNFESPDGNYPVTISEQPIRSDNIFLYHKTTNRKIYAAPPEPYKDTLLFNENGAFTEFTIGNLVVELDGELYTPPIYDGLLPGVFRSHLLDTGEIKERSIYKAELHASKKIYMINSVRKWTEVKLKEKKERNK